MFRAAKCLQLFLHDFGVFDHGNAAALRHFALQGDRFTAVLSQLIVHWLVFADDQIRFALTNDSDRAAALDALGSARLPVLLAESVVIDVTHHIHDFPGNFFGSGRISAVLVVLRDRQLLASDGIAMIVVTIDSQNGRVLGDAELVTRGIVFGAGSEEILDEARARIAKTLARTAGEGATDQRVVKNALREAVNQYFWEKMRTRPMVIPIVMEV